MPTEDMAQVVDGLAHGVMAADAGNIATIAPLLERLTALRTLAAAQGLLRLDGACGALQHVVQQIIMDEGDAAQSAYTMLSDGVTAIQQAVELDELALLPGLPPDIETQLGQPRAEALFLQHFNTLRQDLWRHLGALQQNPAESATSQALVDTLSALAAHSTGLAPAVAAACRQVATPATTHGRSLDTTVLENILRWIDGQYERLAARQRDAPGAARSHTPPGSGNAVVDSVTETRPDPVMAPAPGVTADADATQGEQTAEAPGAALSGDRDLLQDFVAESRDHLELANAQLLALEAEPRNTEALNCVFRAFHTIKGISGFLQLPQVERLSHTTENLLDRVRTAAIPLTAEVLDAAFSALDMVMRMIERVRDAMQGNGWLPDEPGLPALLEAIAAAEQQATNAPAPLTSPARTGSTADAWDADDDDKDDDDAMGPVRLRDAASLAAQGGVTPETGESGVRGRAPRETIRVDYHRLEAMVDTIGELVIAEAAISQDPAVASAHSGLLSKKLHNLKQVSRKLQEFGTAVRMVPIAGTFQKLARVVRDLSRKSGKPVQLHVEGEDTEIDRAFVDNIGDPLMHMVRNAMDHGIEPPAVRAAAGKPPGGAIHLRAFHEGGNIHVEIEDDGQGLDKAAILAKAVQRGLIAEGAQPSEQEIFDLIFQPGFSTAATVTEVSGRGVGMDVVRRNVQNLRGTTSIASIAGQGTTFRLTLPLTMALIDGMVVRVGHARLILPVQSVVESVRPTRRMLQSVLGQGELLNMRHGQLPLYRMARLFDIPEAEPDPTRAVAVIVERNGSQWALLVDELLGLQQTVVKSLGPISAQAGGVSGGAIMADGTVGLILDIPSLIAIAQRSPATSAPAVPSAAGPAAASPAVGAIGQHQFSESLSHDHS